MDFNAQLAKVECAEKALEVREQRTRMQWQQFKATWRAGWTPGRIVVAGLAAGFAAGRAKPLRLAGSGGVLDLLRALTPLFVGVQAAQAAAEELQSDPSATQPETPPSP